MLKKDDREKQMVYYQAGIGTYVTPQIATPMASRISKVKFPILIRLILIQWPSQKLDEMLAWNLHSHVMGERLSQIKKHLSVIKKPLRRLRVSHAKLSVSVRISLIFF